jgi:hypothetical protein
MADPSSLTNVQVPTDLIPRMSSTLARLRGTSSSIPWTTDELFASAAKSVAASKNQYSSSLGAEPKVVSGPPNANLTAASQHTTTRNVNPNPAPVSYQPDSLELATPTAPFMNPLPQHHHQSNQQGNQMSHAPSPLPAEQGRFDSSFVEYQHPQAASPYPPSMSHYATPQQHMYPNQPQLPAPHSYRPPTQQQPLSQSTTPKSHPASVYPWNASIGASPQTNIQKPPAASSADNVTISPATTAQSASTAATSATMLPSGSSRPSTATYDSHDTSPVIPNYPAPALMQSQTAGHRGLTPQSMQANVQPQRTAHPIAMQMSAAAAGVSPPAPPQISYLSHSGPYQHSHRNSMSLSRPNDVGEWTAEEVARLHAIIRNSHANVGYQTTNGMGGSGGTTPETDWQKVVNAFNSTRPRCVSSLHYSNLASD